VVWARIGGVAAAGVTAIVTGLPVAAAATVASPGPAGPYPVHAAASPGLCWQAAGNGSPVTLETCDQTVQGQQWTLTGNGVFMNGNGYCLEAGTGDRLYLGFDGQCGGTARSQQWAFRDGQWHRRATAVCAAPAGSLAPGTAIVAGACDRASWSFGASAAAASAPAASARPGAARPATQPSEKAHQANTAVAGPAAGQGGGEQAALMTAGLVLFGGLLVLVGWWSRRGRRARVAGPGGLTAGGRLDDSGPYVVDVTEEVRRRPPPQSVVDTRPTEPFDVSSIF
jgi:hypothetical protein